MSETVVAAVPVASVSVLEFRAGSLAAITGELTQPTLRLNQLEGGRQPAREVQKNWAELQVRTASAVANGRPVTTEPVVSHYVAAVVTHFTYWWHDLVHDSAAGSHVRGAITDEVAPVLGLPLVSGLVRRPLLTLVSDTHPFWGWATHSEVAEAVGGLEPASMSDRQAQTVELRAFRSCLEAAATRGLDLVTLYDGPPGGVH